MRRTRIKICGITRKEDLLAAAALGVDALGFVFVQTSPRCINIERGRQLLDELPPFIQSVGLFMNQSETEIREIIKALPLNLLQFHGDETPAFCAKFSMPYIKAVPMGAEIEVAKFAARFPQAHGFLLDSHSPGKMGGSGEAFDWKRIPPELSRPVILAGGLNIDNVAQAVHEVRPYAVDVSSGVEAARGIKDPEKMAAFIRGVRAGDESAAEFH